MICSGCSKFKTQSLHECVGADIWSPMCSCSCTSLEEKQEMMRRDADKPNIAEPWQQLLKIWDNSSTTTTGNPGVWSWNSNT